MKKNREVICTFMAWALSVCFFLCCFMLPGLNERITSLGNSNILVYGMSLILFCVLFTMGMGLTSLSKGESKNFLEQTKIKKGAFCLILLLQIPFWAVCVAGETEQLGSVASKYGWHTQHPLIIALLFLAEAAIFFWACENVYVPEKKGRMDHLVYLYSIGCACFLQHVYTKYLWQGRTERCISWACLF